MAPCWPKPDNWKRRSRFFNGLFRASRIFRSARHLGDALAGTGSLDEAIPPTGRSFGSGPTVSRLTTNSESCTKDQFGEAIAAHRQAIQLKPDFAEAHNNLGNALRSNGQSDEAAASLQQAIRLKPDYALAYYNLGNVLKDNRRLGEAAALFARLSSSSPIWPRRTAIWAASYRTRAGLTTPSSPFARPVGTGRIFPGCIAISSLHCTINRMATRERFLPNTGHGQTNTPGH